MQCAVLAGGLATRMLPATAEVPKTLLEVAGRPFADWQLEWLAAQGVTRVVYCIAHLGDQIRHHIGDGGRWGLAVTYSDEGQRLLGTAGALRRAADDGLLDDAFLVLYGDSYLEVPVPPVWEAFLASGRPALMTVYRNELYEPSNVLYRAGMVVAYDKRPEAAAAAEMHHIDYGLQAFTRSVIEQDVASGEACDLSALQAALAARGALAGYEVSERYYEIGSVQGRSQLDAHLGATTTGAATGGVTADRHSSPV